ncbi:MAG: WhiB family transcriptional regulator [Acidimicrobiia bacterium]
MPSVRNPVRPHSPLREEEFVTSIDRSWQPVALCRGNHSHLFFPPTTSERKEERERRELRAKAVCQVCPVQADCLDYALESTEQYGIWGGYTETERRQLPAARKRVAAAV